MNQWSKGSKGGEGKALSRILNREDFLYLLDLEVKRARRYQNFFCILLLKIHRIQEGDNVGDLKSCYQKLTNLLIEELRDSDILGSLKEDRLAVLLPYVDQSDGDQVKSRFHGDLQFCNFAGDGCEVTVDQISFPLDGTDSMDLMDKVLGTERA